MDQQDGQGLKTRLGEMCICLNQNQLLVKQPTTVVPGGAAYRTGSVELGKHESFGCHLVQVGGGGGRVAIAGQVSIPKLQEGSNSCNYSLHHNLGYQSKVLRLLPTFV